MKKINLQILELLDMQGDFVSLKNISLFSQLPIREVMDCLERLVGQHYVLELIEFATRFKYRITLEGSIAVHFAHIGARTPRITGGPLPSNA